MSVETVVIFDSLMNIKLKRAAFVQNINIFNNIQVHLNFFEYMFIFLLYLTYTFIYSRFVYMQSK